MSDYTIFKLIQVLENFETAINAEQEKSVFFPLEHTLLHILDRVQYSLYSLKTLSTEDIYKNHHGIGLLLRNLTSDFLLWLQVDSLETEDRKVEFLNQIYKSDFDKMDKLVSDFIKAGNAVGKMESYKSDPIYINLQAVKKQSINNKAIFDNLRRDEAKRHHTIAVTEVYQMYVYFSKYEHLGYFSWTETRNFKPSFFTAAIEIVLFYTSVMLYEVFDFLHYSNFVEAMEKTLIELAPRKLAAEKTITGYKL